MATYYLRNSQGEELRVRTNPYTYVAVDLKNGYCKSGWEENVQTFPLSDLKGFLWGIQLPGDVTVEIREG